MSSASWYVFCPRCGSPAFVTYENRTSEEFLSCRFCGYSTGRQIDWEKWIEGQPYPEPQDYEHKGTGAFYIRNKRGGGQLGHLENKENCPQDWKEIIEEFREMFKDPDVDQDESYLTKWDEEKKKVVILIGNPKLRIGDECPSKCPDIKKCLEKFPQEEPEKCPRLSLNTVSERSLGK